MKVIPTISAFCKGGFANSWETFEKDFVEFLATQYPADMTYEQVEMRNKKKLELIKTHAEKCGGAEVAMGVDNVLTNEAGEAWGTEMLADGQEDGCFLNESQPDPDDDHEDTAGDNQDELLDPSYECEDQDDIITEDSDTDNNETTPEKNTSRK